ncbi:MAG: Maf family protein [Miltoncostaeaceae bacterium]
MLILASRSPQRRALLRQIGLDFRVIVAEVEEGDDPMANALAKARNVAARTGDRPVLGVDTVVRLDDRVLGKPVDEAEARAMIASLARRDHVVESALALLTTEGEETASSLTSVAFRDLDNQAVADYVATGEWHGRAGGYAIQGRGAALVTRIEGDYTNVVGLPVGTAVDLLAADRASRREASLP